MVTAIHGFQNSGRKRSNNVIRILIATILVATIEISQVKAFSSLGLASRFLSHHYTPQYMIDLPPVDRYNTYGQDTSEVENEVGMMEEIPMKKSKLYRNRPTHEEVDDTTKTGTGEEDILAMEYEPAMEKLVFKTQKRHNISFRQPSRRTPAEMNKPELEKYLQNFYLIKTPYGYVLGRQNSGLSANSLERRSFGSNILQ